MIKIAVLVSGNGSNLQALIDANLSGKIVGVLSNRPNAYALQRAQQANIATHVIEHKNSLPVKLLMLQCSNSFRLGM
jgi:phosphoribosylglycinamide formyltransferase-1